MAAGSRPQISMLDIEFAQLSDPGRVRDHNEDYLGHVAAGNARRRRASHGWLFVLADGVGGHERGEVASRAAVETMLAGFPQRARRRSRTPRCCRAWSRRPMSVSIEAGRAASPGGVAMATTIVACALRYDRAVIAHVGDSRCYLIRHGHATLLTRDHTVANEQVRLGS